MRRHIPNSFRKILFLLSICGTQFAHGENKSWTGSISTDWAVAGNWNPAGIPGDTDDVTIPSSAVNQPVLSADAHSATLTVQTGAHLSIGSFTLLTNGNIDASDIAGTTGSVQVNGTGVSIKGKFPNLTISGTANLLDTVHVTGNLIIDALLRSANLILNGKSIIVGGDFSTQNNGKLTMVNPSDVLTIGGNATFAGAPLAGLDTAGLISVKGNFGQYYTGSNWDDFAVSGRLKVILNGTSPQTVHFDNAGEFGQTSHFKDLQIANPTKVMISTNAQVNGDITISAADSLDGAGTLTVMGNISTIVNSHVTLAGLRLGGSMAVSGSFSPGTTEFFGTNQTIQPGLNYRDMLITGAILLSDTTRASGNLTINGSGGPANLILNGKTVIVSGDFSTQNNGKLTMLNPADLLSIGGNATFAGAPLTGLDTAGVISVKGNFGQYYAGSDWDDFAASGTLKVILNGTSSQTVHFDNPGTAGQSSYFRDLEISNPKTVTLDNTTYVNGNLTVSGPDSLKGNITLIIVGTLTTAPGSSITLNTIELDSSMSVSGSFTPATTVFNGNNQVMQAGLGYKEVLVNGHARFGGTTTVSGNLTAGGPARGVIDLNGQSVTVTGDYSSGFYSYYEGGTLIMRSPSGVLRVSGNVNFDGSPTDTLLTAGTIYVGGTFRIGKNFVATGTHQVIFNGSSAQAINENFDYPHSHFRDMRISNAAGVAINANVLVNRNLRIDASASLGGSASLVVNGAVTTLAGSSVTVANFELDSTMSVAGAFSPGMTTFGGSGQLIQAGLGYKNVTVNGRASFAGTSTVSGNLTAGGPARGVIDLNGQSVTVTGDYSSGYYSNYEGGTLIMRNPAGVLRVSGNVNFDGSPTDTTLTSGAMYVGGSFTLNKNFTASGSHKVVFSGSSRQSISGNVSSANHFNGLQLSNPAGIVLGSDVFANGQLVSRPSLHGTALNRRILATVANTPDSIFGG